ncbi:hypothetical protein JAAARDRAFT_155600 [Jaapia argillacea MUCL 33604]|uniref:BTB domain-containing protein n=1 Tax=Jaapia argillacea MUCL 33604 TaxID=933084 RepID=A0A067PT12_9AGAM|nr:hypothetical protein JAAARDRAFT_155600 [Jaapia argillacea MUCL 33604]
MDEFNEYISPTAGIKGILSQYSFGNGFLREILQNSEDAGATEQVFILDYRTHAKESLFDECYQVSQGPALLAYNNAIFQEKDWTALIRPHKSSKGTDRTKIGKYGMGFRSSYHITDTPQILSDRFLAVLDPHRGGKKIDFVEEGDRYRDQLAGFDRFFPLPQPGQGWNVGMFEGTVIRLPLRTEEEAKKSELSNKAIRPPEIHQLFLSFIESEIDQVLLFLSNLASIKICEIDEEGKETHFATVTISRTPPILASISTSANQEERDRCTSHLCTVDLQRLEKEKEKKTWRILHCPFSSSHAADLVAARLDSTDPPDLEKEKLVPDVGLAIPLPLPPAQSTGAAGVWDGGRLFTYLPLPIPTGFAFHVHAPFALTGDRQRLQNVSETGISGNSTAALYIAWNRVLFSDFIPRAIARLLLLLVEHPSVDDGIEADADMDIYAVWPPPQAKNPSGEAVYWASILKDIVSASVSVGKIWPAILGTDKETQRYLDLGAHDAFLANGNEGEGCLEALARAGLDIVRPPRHVEEAVMESGVKFESMGPDEVWRCLLSKKKLQSDMDVVDADARRKVLSYLLSTNKLQNIVGLELIPVVGHGHAALIKSSDGVVRTLLAEEDERLWDQFDPSAVMLSRLPSPVADLLTKEGPGCLNVQVLTVERVGEYLSVALRKFGIDVGGRRDDGLVDTGIGGESLKWLAKFWVWVASWENGPKLLDSIRDLPLLPTDRGRVCGTQLFAPHPNIDAEARRVLDDLLVQFLPVDFPASPRDFMEGHGIIKSSADAHHLLSHLENRFGNRSMGESDAKVLRRVLAMACQNARSLSLDDRRTLRSLPIFPQATALGSLTQNLPIDSADSNDLPFLPTISSRHFVVGTGDCLTLVRYMRNQLDLHPLTRPGLLELSIDHLADQPRSFQRAIVDHLVARRADYPDRLVEKLRDVGFLTTQDHVATRAPREVVDPDSELASLFLKGDQRLPLIADDDHDSKAIMAGLRTLKCLCVLKDDIVSERISFISASPKLNRSVAHRMACTLLRLMNESKESIGLALDQSVRWLPCIEGKSLHSSRECYPPNIYHPKLFDQVAATLSVKVDSPTLLAALGWDGEIPFAVVKKQLAAVGDYDSLVVLVKHFAKRIHGGSQDVDGLREMTQGRAWIPIAPNRIAKTSHVVFGMPRASPFHQIPPSLTRPDYCRTFFSLMGCADRPSNIAIYDELAILADGPPSRSTPRLARDLLDELAEIPNKERPRVLVPDTTGSLRPLDNVCYDDRRHDWTGFEVPEGMYAAHNVIDVALAAKLDLPLLSSISEVEDEEPEDESDMKQDVTIRIKQELRQYTLEQAFGEFVANAADAKAHKFDLVVDERPGPLEHLLCEHMEQFQSSPALVLHNNASFSDEDFRRIRNFGGGGKDAESIGRFGLGAFSMYHFTEVVTIISGGYALFLDPSRRHLRLFNQKGTALLVPLKKMRRSYRGHLEALGGMFDFSISNNYYNGTLFRLPLRTASQAAESHMSTTSVSISRVLSLVDEKYFEIARQSVLFTGIEKITAQHRRVGRDLTFRWKVSAKRRDTPEGLFKVTTTHRLGIDEWYVTTQSQDVPDEFRSLLETHGIPGKATVGLAARTSPSSDTRSKFFSTLPLPIDTCLPVHLHATFILAQDRRSIRFEESNEISLEIKYNRWLLSELVPPLYLSLLETSVNSDDCSHWWPGRRSCVQEPLGELVIQSLFSRHFASCSRPICRSLSGHRVAPQNGVFLGAEHASIRKVLEVVSPPDLITLPSSIHLRALQGGIATPTPAYVRDNISQGFQKMMDAWQKGELKIDDVARVVSFLSKDPQTLRDLPLLPLADKTLTTFQQSRAIPIYFTRDLLPPSLFPSNRFAHHSIAPDLEPLSSTLNVSALAGDGVATLIRERFPRLIGGASSPDDHGWIARFWTYFDDLPVDAADIADLPLVATESDRYISIQKCRTHPVLLSLGSQASLVVPALLKLGADIIAADIPIPLRRVLDQLPPFGINEVMRFFRTFTDISARFCTLPDDERKKLAEWIRDNIRLVDVEHKSVARQLPVWVSQTHAKTEEVSACDSRLVMLPVSVKLATVERFLETRWRYHSYSSGLCHLNAEPIKFPALRDKLDFASRRVLSASELNDYGNLLALLLAHYQLDGRTMLVPQGNLVLAPSSALYARSEPLFLHAFETNEDTHFVHRQLRAYEPSLVNFGLRSEVTFDLFRECAQAMNDHPEGPNRLVRARYIFEYFRDQLPVRVPHTENPWRAVADLRFIPKKPYSSCYQKQEFIRGLPDIVSPNQTLRPQHFAIAWTQRAPFPGPDESRILLADKSLGVPSGQDVVHHLRVLATRVALEYQLEDVLEDIRQTYKWLNDHLGEADALVNYHQERLFLNVDDASDYTSWKWDRASDLYFNSPDEDNRRMVRKFLLPFKELVLFAGGKEIRNPSPPSALNSDSGDIFSHWRMKLRQMREDHILTDVVYISNGGTEHPAHRCILLVNGDHFARELHFEGNHPGGVHRTEMLEYSPTCLETTLNFLYTQELPDVDTNVLLELLSLSHCWELTRLNLAVQRQLVQPNHLTVGSYDEIRRFSTPYQLEETIVTAKCDEFEDLNRRHLRG